MLGKDFFLDSNLNSFERLYIRFLGIPVLGLRIRAWRMLPIIKKYTKESGYILDFGCGRGVFAMEIAKMMTKSRVVGIDLLRDKVKTAGEITGKINLRNCKFVSINIFEWNKSDKFDSIVAIDVLEHIKDDSQMVKRLGALLKSRGRLIIHVPSKYRNLFGIKRINFDIEGHVRPGYTMNEIEKLASAAGLKVVKKGYTYSSLETLANDLSYLITQGREKRKILLAIFFPFLLVVASLGSRVRPKSGSGLYLVGEKT